MSSPSLPSRFIAKRSDHLDPVAFKVPLEAKSESDLSLASILLFQSETLMINFELNYSCDGDQSAVKACALAVAFMPLH